MIGKPNNMWWAAIKPGVPQSMGFNMALKGYCIRVSVVDGWGL